VSSLRAVFDRHGTDKGCRHGYDEVYERFNQPRRLLEIGVFRGASLRAWQEWWPGTELHGMDTFERGLAEVPGATLWSGDSAKVRPSDLINVDLIIDDGRHIPAAQAATFRNLAPLLGPGGVYVIEDVWALDRMTTEQLRHPWLQAHVDQFTPTHYAELWTALDGYEVIRHDLRQAHQPDSYMLEVRG